MLMSSTPVFAQTAATLTVNASVSGRAKLSIASGTSHSITFNDADPDTTPTLTAPAFDVDVKARTGSNSTVSLTVLAAGDLTSGTDTIGIDNLTWAASGDMVAGTSSTSSAVSVGSWTGSGRRQGTQTYSLVNSWAYATGNYSATLNYTLTAP
jgi:hypothetical protein